MNPADPQRMRVAAGRETLRRIHGYLENGVSFAIETTLASKRALETMREAKTRGFTVQIAYVCLNTPERCILRVQQRALQGGHDVPDEDIRRRYDRSLANLPEAILVADRAILYDNSENEYRKILELQHDLIHWRATKEPQWVAVVRVALLR